MAVQQSADDTTAGRLMRADYGYGPGNLLGPVSQNAGVPTGAVIENGTNANGGYVRFADGTQICRQKIDTVAIDQTTSLSGLYRTSEIAWTFPAAFVNDVDANGPMILARASHYSVIGSNTQNLGLTTLAAKIRFFSFTSVSNAIAQVIAIGRWV